MSILEAINSPEDVKKLNETELRLLAKEMRQKIIDTVKANGGHLASNLGVIELTIALHKIFNSPKDAIVWDVGHQSYAHKLLTGRLRQFERIRKKNGLSGFPKRSESVHDIFDTGHSSTSLSSALGLLEARKRRGEDGKVIAVIGDGAMTAGMAYEALSNVSPLGLPLIIILNDNKMSISPNVGALSRYLSRLSASVRYQTLRAKLDNFLRLIPYLGPYLKRQIERLKRAVKAIFFKENFFVDLGFEYVGPIDGHNIPVLLRVFEQVQRLNRPVVVHVVTRKGKGYDEAEEDPEAFHGISPSCTEEAQTRPSFTEIFGQSMLDTACERRDVVAITAAMTTGTGLGKMKKMFPWRIYDVGIAEQHAVTFAAGLATGGMQPVVAIYSTFMQRALDQVLHDVALPNLPVVFALDRAGAVGEDGETHQGIYDISLFKSLPNMTMLAPSNAAELRMSLKQALALKGPVIIRYPKAKVECDDETSDTPLVTGRGVFLRKRQKAAALVCALGPMAQAAARVSDRLAGEGFFLDVYSLRYICPIDEPYLAGVCSGYAHVITIEDGVRTGGVGESVAAILARRSINARISILGFDSMPRPQATREELLHDAGLDEAGLYAFIRAKVMEGKGSRLYETIPLAVGR